MIMELQARSCSVIKAMALKLKGLRMSLTSIPQVRTYLIRPSSKMKVARTASQISHSLKKVKTRETVPITRLFITLILEEAALQISLHKIKTCLILSSRN